MANPFGRITPPGVLENSFGDVESGGIGVLINTFLNILVAVAGIYAVFNFVFAGFAFLSAGGDPKKVENAWKKIWQSVLGLAVAAGAFVLAGLIGWLLFGTPNALLNPAIVTP